MQRVTKHDFSRNIGHVTRAAHVLLNPELRFSSTCSDSDPHRKLKTIHIIRHPIDVSASLLRRQQKEIKLDIKRKKKISNVVKALLSISHTNYNASMILNSHNDCFNLIELYYDQIVNNQSGQSLVIRFEDILSNPKLEIISLLEYCRISVDSDKLNQILSKGQLLIPVDPFFYNLMKKK